MSVITGFILGNLTTGAIFAVVAFLAGLSDPKLLVAIGILAAGIQALFFLVWYLIQTQRKIRAASAPSENRSRAA